MPKSFRRRKEKELPIFKETAIWLDAYFRGEQPSFVPAYRYKHLSDFQKEVTKMMLLVPYGETITYGEIAKMIAPKQHKKMSAQAVGGAVGRNPICLIVPVTV